MQLLREGHSFSGHERNCVFLNGRGSRFANISAVSGLDFNDDGRAVAVTDWDLDGDLDVWLYNRTGPRLRLMQNQTISAAGGQSDRYVAARLQGTTSNRDAIGARVELVTKTSAASDSQVDKDPRQRMIQTLTAGDAFLSQSTKWLHFGLATDASGEEASGMEFVVRWPTGKTERFPGIQRGRRYRLVEGAGKAAQIPKVQRRFMLEPSVQPKAKTAARQRVFLSNRLPLPALRYQTAKRTEAEMQVSKGRPLLVVIWASWCAPCLEELSALASDYPELKSEGLDILALSVDGLDSTRTSDWADAQQVSDRLQLPFPTGSATREMLDKWELAESVLFNRTPALSVPYSFLVDGEGAISVIYRGGVQTSQLMTDLRQLNTPMAGRRQLTVPFSGRWTNAPRQMLASAVARLYRQNGYEEDYVRFLQFDAERIDRLREYAASDEQRSEIDRQYANAHFNLGLALSSADDFQNALVHFRSAVRVEPDHVEALINLGAMLAQQGDIQEAILTLRRAVRIDADSVPARMNLAAALGSVGNFGASLEHYRHVVKTAPETRNVHARLARALLEQDQAVEAVPHLVDAIKADGNDFPSTLSLAWLRATHPADSLRDGRQAVQLAGQLNATSRGRDPRVLDVLAAALAESGDFERARQMAAAALKRMGTGSSELKALMQARLERYQQAQPFRDHDGRYP